MCQWLSRQPSVSSTLNRIGQQLADGGAHTAGVLLVQKDTLENYMQRELLMVEEALYHTNLSRVSGALKVGNK